VGSRGGDEPMRQHGWDVRLFDYVESHRNTPFEWGGMDCCLFTAGCVEACTGKDFATDLRGYKSEQEAYAIVARYGSIQAMVTALLGAEPIHPAFAQRGDVMLGLHPETQQEGLGICLGVHWAVPGAAGLVFPRIAAARFAWRV